MTESTADAVSRGAFAHRYGLTDMGHLPERIRRIAGFFGGSTAGAQALYQLAQTDGLTQSIDELRLDIASVHDPKVRDELLAWVRSREH
ncbi:MAG: hypothetical protein WCA32_14535 [Chromatiaceae bacterium]|jgi:hypothetical protein